MREIFSATVYGVAFVAFSILFLYATKVCFSNRSKRRKLAVPLLVSPVMASFLGSSLFYLLFWWPLEDNSAILFFTILRVLALYGTIAVVEILFLILYLRYIQPIQQSFAVFLHLTILFFLEFILGISTFGAHLFLYWPVLTSLFVVVIIGIVIASYCILILKPMSRISDASFNGNRKSFVYIPAFTMLFLVMMMTTMHRMTHAVSNF